MSTDESPNFKEYTHTQRMITIDYPSHWNVEVDKSHPLSVVFKSPEMELASILIIAMPSRIDSALFKTEQQTQDFLHNILNSAGIESGGQASRLLYYPSHWAKLTDGTDAWATLHDDLMVVIQTHSPESHEHIYRPLLERMLTSFRIHRSKEVAHFRLLNDVASELKQHLPNADLQVADDRIKLDQLEIGVDNLAASIMRHPGLREELIKDYVKAIMQSVIGSQQIGQEVWEDVKGSIYPMIRADSILRALGDSTDDNEPAATRQSRRVASSPWLADLLVCYAIDSAASIRMISNLDLNRWGKDLQEVHARAMRNLVASEFPSCMAVPGADGQVMLCGFGEGGISAKSSYLLHPHLYKQLKPKFSARIWAAIPNRDSLMFFSSHCSDRATLLNAVAQDHKQSDHPISDRLFEITPDGIVLA